MITGKWILLFSLFTRLAFGEVAHQISIEIDPDARRVLVEDTVSVADGGTVSVGLPQLPGIVDLLVDGSALSSQTMRATARSPMRVTYTWQVPSIHSVVDNI